MVQNVILLQSFFIGSIVAYDDKFHQQVYLDNCAYKTVNKQMKDYPDDNLFETYEGYVSFDK